MKIRNFFIFCFVCFIVIFTFLLSSYTSFAQETTTQTPGLPQKVYEAIRSKIEASGRKMAEVKYSQSWYLNAPEGITYTPEPIGFSMAQELQFRLSGRVGEKVTVNIDYDDTQKKKQKISVVYSGESRDVIQDVNFGDITLSLPGTEFVAYNKQLFGLSIKGQYEKLKFNFIGSQSKGYSETKEFKGRSTQQVKDILDTNYSKMRYYTLGRHISSGKEKIYIDDKNYNNNTNNTINRSFTDSGDSITGDFDPQYTGIDYNINYGLTSNDSTVISFIRSIETNYVIIVYDIDSNDTFAIKDEFNSETRTNRYELKNYYYLGNRGIIPKEQDINFVLEVRNLDNTVDSIIAIAPTSQISGVKYYGIIDYDFGTLRLTDPTGKQDVKPFSPDAYLLTNPVHNYTIHTEYKSRIKIFLLRPNIVEESEKVYLDGRLLTRDVDYTIDYESGWFSFIREDDIKEESYIKIDYEYAPFGGQYVETVVGMRAELPLSSDFSIGSTYLFSGTPSPDEIPGIRSTPQSHQIIDVDSQIRPLSLISKLFPGIARIPVTMSLAGEAAYSWKNPNTFGKAMVEDMEGIRLSVDMPVDMYSWRISSAPKIPDASDEETQSARGNYTLENKDEGHDPSSTSARSLLINYTISDSGWISICYPISRYAQDYSQYNALEFWVKSPPSDIKFFIDLGIISEDSDGRGGFPGDAGAWKAGQPKTEDINGDGKLNLGEDVGWNFIKYDGSIVKIGAGNKRLDTQDLDGDGQLNAVNQKIHTFDGLDAACIVATSGNWKLYRIPFTAQVKGDTDWTMVKHMRLWLKNPTGVTKNGTIQMDAISIVGNKWANISMSDTTGGNTFTVEARNTKDHAGYYNSPRDYIGKSDDDKDGDGINDYFEELYPSFETVYGGLSKSLWPKEQSMALIYYFNTPGQGSTTQKWTSAMNFTDYRKLKFWIYPTANSSGCTLVLRFGMDDTTCYEYQMKVDASMEQKWTLKSIDIRSLNELTKFSPAGVEDREILYNIKQITIGVSDTSTGGAKREIWLDELHLDEVEVKEGYAWKVALSTDIANGLLNIGYNRKQITHKFETVGVATPAEDYDYQGVNGTLIVSRFMPAQWGISLPLSGSWSKTRTYLEPSSAQDVPQSRLGERSQESQNYNLQFTRSYIPNLSGSYGKSELYSNFKGAEQYEIYQPYSGSTSYSYVFPRKLFYLIPTGHSLSSNVRYSISGDKREVRPAQNSETVAYLQNQTHDFGLDFTSNPIPNLTFTPSYSIRQTSQEQPQTKTPLSNVFRPISSNQNVRVGCGTSLIKGVSPSITFDESVNENYFFVSDLFKNVSASASIGVSANVTPESWYNALKFFNFYNSFNIGINTAYDNLSQSIDFWNITNDIWQVFQDLKESISPISDNRKTASNKKSYSLSSNLYFWDPLSTGANFSWGQDESQNQGSFNQVNSLAYGGSARLDLNQAFPIFKKISQSSYFMGNYNHRISETVNVSKATSSSPSCSWQVRWNPDLNQYYSLNYTFDTEERGAYLKNTSILSPSLKTDYYFRFPISIKIPFLKPIVLTNKLDLTNTTDAEIKRVKEDNKTESTNRVNSSLGLTYNVAENLLTTFTFSFTYFNNMEDYTKDYIALSIALRGVIRF